MKRLFAALPLATACLAAPAVAQDRNPDFAAAPPPSMPNSPTSSTAAPAA